MPRRILGPSDHPDAGCVLTGHLRKFVEITGDNTTAWSDHGLLTWSSRVTISATSCLCEQRGRNPVLVATTVSREGLCGLCRSLASPLSKLDAGSRGAPSGGLCRRLAAHRQQAPGWTCLPDDSAALPRGGNARGVSGPGV